MFRVRFFKRIKQEGQNIWLDTFPKAKLIFRIDLGQLKIYQWNAPYATSYLMEIAMLILSVTILDILAIAVGMTLTRTFRKGQGQI